MCKSHYATFNVVTDDVLSHTALCLLWRLALLVVGSSTAAKMSRTCGPPPAALIGTDFSKPQGQTNSPNDLYYHHSSLISLASRLMLSRFVSRSDSSSPWCIHPSQKPAHVPAILCLLLVTVASYLYSYLYQYPYRLVLPTCILELRPVLRGRLAACCGLGGEIARLVRFKRGLKFESFLC